MTDITNLLISQIELLAFTAGAFAVGFALMIIAYDQRTRVLDKYRTKYGFDKELESSTAKTSYDKRMIKLAKKKEIDNID